MSYPIIFIWHGSPMNAIETNIYTESWRHIGESISTKPRAILMFSAHWITEGSTHISTSEKLEMIYDMYWFPDELYRVAYNASGSGIIAKEISDSLKEYTIKEDQNRGLDHWAWSVLIHLFPGADIPVASMSLDYRKDAAWHFELGKKLQDLRERWILIIWSGNIVHNLRAIDWSDRERYDWAVSFDAKISESIVSKKYDDIIDFRSWDTARLAHPSHDHLLPLFPLLWAVDPRDTIEFYTPEITMGSLSMRSIVWR